MANQEDSNNPIMIPIYGLLRGFAFFRGLSKYGYHLSGSGMLTPILDASQLFPSSW